MLALSTIAAVVVVVVVVLIMGKLTTISTIIIPFIPTVIIVVAIITVITVIMVHGRRLSSAVAVAAVAGVVVHLLFVVLELDVLWGPRPWPQGGKQEQKVVYIIRLLIGCGVDRVWGG